MHDLNPLFPHFWIEVGVALFCGVLIGIEREIRGKPTGMRTCVLIVLGTALFVRLGSTMAVDKGDASRVLGQVVTGIGFLGAGVIMGRDNAIVGVTTASVVWILAAIGALIGAGQHAAATLISLITLACLIGLEMLEHWLKRFIR